MGRAIALLHYAAWSITDDLAVEYEHGTVRLISPRLGKAFHGQRRLMPTLLGRRRAVLACISSGEARHCYQGHKREALTNGTSAVWN